MGEHLWDVIEVEIRSPHRIRVLTTKRTLSDAESYIDMAVYRRGVEDHFFTEAPAGTYKDGDLMEQKP